MQTTEKLLTDLTRKVDRLNAMVSDMRKEKAKETWVKVSTIQELTIWNDGRKMEQARKQGLLKQRKGTNGIEYLLESVNQIFFIKSQTL